MIFQKLPLWSSISILSLFLMLGIGCGSSLQTNNSLLPGGEKGVDDGDHPLPTDPTRLPIPDNLDFSSFISSHTFNGFQVVDIDRVKKELVLRLPLGQNPYFLINAGNFSKLPGVTFQTELSRDGNASLALRIPLKYLLRGVNSLNPSRLPNGDPLPFAPQSELPSLALSLDAKGGTGKIGLNLYLGVDFVGIFVETPFNPGFGISVPIKNQARTQVLGYFSLIAAKQDFQGGFFLSYQLPPQLAAAIEKYISP